MSRINTNVQSIVAARVLNTQQQTLSQTLTRLSTGLRINSGRDDPAGLIASESLRAEQTAIRAAIGNAERATSVVSVAEAGLQEISSLLLSLENLVDRSANEAGLSSDEVTANQLEIDSILSTIDRIANSTTFNGKKLLNGTLAYNTSGISAPDLAAVRIAGARLPDNGSRSVIVQVTQSAQTAGLIYGAVGGPGLSAAGNVTIQVGGNFGSEIYSFAGSTAISAIQFAVNQSTQLTGVSAAVSGNNLKFNSSDYGDQAFVSVQATSGTFTVTGGSSATRDEGLNAAVLVNGTSADVNGLEASVNTDSLSVALTLTAAFGTTLQTTNFTITDGGANFAISPTLELSGRVSLGVDSVTSGSLGNTSLGFLSSIASGQTNALSQKNFGQDQRVIREAISQISTLRGRLGAFLKNTLDSTIGSLQITLENVTAAESAIRDADFAFETSRLTRSQILVAAATQTLQIANAAPQVALQLLG
ncbi:MAG: flagellin [Phycisphaerae bacterium]